MAHNSAGTTLHQFTIALAAAAEHSYTTPWPFPMGSRLLLVQKGSPFTQVTRRYAGARPGFWIRVADGLMWRRA